MSTSSWYGRWSVVIASCLLKSLRCSRTGKKSVSNIITEDLGMTAVTDMCYVEHMAILSQEEHRRTEATSLFIFPYSIWLFSFSKVKRTIKWSAFKLWRYLLELKGISVNILVALHRSVADEERKRLLELRWITLNDNQVVCWSEYK